MPKETNKEKALTALLNSASITEAAAKSGLSERTLYRFLDEEEFKKEYRAARRQVFEQDILRLQSLHSEAVDTLQKNLHCENPAVETRCAQIIVESCRKDFETLDILSRLEELESEHQKQTQKNGK